jgi:hypothetical protein
MSTEPTRPTAASIERGRLIAESMMDRATAEYRARLAEERSEPPRPPAEAHSGAPNTSETGSDRGTGVAATPVGVQAVERTPAETIYRILVLPWGTRHNREHVREVAEGIDAEMRPVYYREAAASLRAIAEHMPDTASAASLRPGIEYAATLLSHTTDDLTEGATP